ncbi:MAG TPA: S46 family peptidase [Nannocystaceae bacterium]|nr:S46 family peptidase [Nannocystaceae bacterium]
MPRSLAAVVALAALLTLGVRAEADEGQWMPRQIAELDADELRAKGLELAPSELYDPAGGGLLEAVVNLGGCSAGFVSADGLIATNHHCAMSAIQAASSVEHDYLKDGFLAKTRAEEIVAKDEDVEIVQRITDVTAKVHEVVAREQDPAARALAVERLGKELVRECEAAAPARRCRMAEFYAGAEFQLIDSLVLRDVRLVYAPPESIGNFGGEVDNWMWPRHTGDFTLLRAYVGKSGESVEHSEANVPYQPKRFLPVASEGVQPGDFVAVLGFPGNTQRYQSSAEVARQIAQALPARAELNREWIDLLEAAGERDAAVRIKVAAKMRSLQNREKNARGMLDGLARNGTLARREQEDEELARWAAAQKDPRYAAALDRLAELSTTKRESFPLDFVLDNSTRGSNALALALDIVRRARERGKPDLERVPAYMDRDAEQLWSTQQRRIRDFDREVDRQLLESWFARVAALPEAQRFAHDEAAKLLRTKVTEAAFAEKLWQADWAAIEQERDPMIAFARDLVPQLEALEQRDRAHKGAMLELGPRWFEMLDAVRSGPVYPDANGTLRISFAHVKGYAPREGLLATPQTTVTGLLAKHTGKAPFDVPQAIRDAAPRAKTTWWADPSLGDVPIAMLADGDTTGGNSGSPVIDGRGRWIGLNFDRVWENIAGDYGWSVERSRNIVVDVRYLLWILDEVVHADALLAELGVAQLADAPARSNDAPASATATATAKGGADIGVPRAQPSEIAPAEVGCGCAAKREATNGLTLLLLALVGIARRRAQPCAEASTTASAE